MQRFWRWGGQLLLLSQSRKLGFDRFVKSRLMVSLRRIRLTYMKLLGRGDIEIMLALCIKSKTVVVKGVTKDKNKADSQKN